MDHFPRRGTLILICLLIHTYVHTYVCMYTHTAVRSYFNCFAGARYFQSNLGIFLKAALYIQRFVDLLKGRLTHSMNTRWG